MVQGHPKDAYEHCPHIDQRPPHHRLRRSQKNQKIFRKQKSQSSCQNRRRHQKDQRVGDHGFNPFFLFRSVKLRHQNAHAGGKSHIQSHKYSVGAAADPHRRQRIRSDEPSHNHGIHDVVKLLKHISQKNRNGKGDQKSRRSSLCHIHLFCAFSCCQHGCSSSSVSQYPIIGMDTGSCSKAAFSPFFTSYSTFPVCRAASISSRSGCIQISTIPI